MSQPEGKEKEERRCSWDGGIKCESQGEAFRIEPRDGEPAWAQSFVGSDPPLLCKGLAAPSDSMSAAG